ncbi:MAG: hypothetical protein IPL47_07675 [Phyllobacteriaceae bacterium]|nr:hypothetical protein [Phyllobacteriaceae bacterium]
MGLIFGAMTMSVANVAFAAADETKIMDADDIVDDATMPFDGMPPLLARQFCAIIVGNPGVMVASIDTRALASDLLGGRAGRAAILATNGSYSAVLDAPRSFLEMPAGNVPPTVFSGKMRGGGATNFADQPAGLPVKLKRGATEIDVSLTASAQGGTYPPGRYATEAILRCE